MTTVLVVEDAQTDRKTLKRLFESAGYVVEMRSDGESALEAFRSRMPAAIVLDLRLPSMSGEDVCREIRKQGFTTPIIVVSGITEESEKVSLLNLGADDYVTKPFSPRELLARVQGAICRARKLELDHIEFGAVHVDFPKMEATFDGRPLELTAPEFKILKFMVANAERVIFREEILCHLSGHIPSFHTRSVDTHIWSMRQKLEENPACPVHILTVRGAGYKFVP